MLGKSNFLNNTQRPRRRRISLPIQLAQTTHNIKTKPEIHYGLIPVIRVRRFHFGNVDDQGDQDGRDADDGESVLEVPLI